MKYKVITQHFGDRQYWAGENREVANAQDAGELIKLGLIAPFDDDNGEQGEDEQDNSPVDPKGKAKSAPKNKADTALQNKADDNGQGE